jgi:glycosyltransferase involved in cell wall biosynthesis
MAKELKHLLVIAPGFPDGEADTACLPFVQQLLLAFRQQYANTAITIITLQYPFVQQQYQWHGMQVYALGGKNKGGLSKLLLCNKAVTLCKSIHNQTPFDAILALCLCETAWVAKRIAAKYALPFAVWMFGEDAKAGNRYFNLIKPTVAQLLPISAWQAAVLEQAYGFKAKHIVNNGINKQIFPELNDAAKRDIDLCGAGSLIPRKQYHLFIEAVKYVKETGYRNVQAVLIGGGAQGAELKSLSAAYGLTDNIVFTGALGHKEVLDWMNRSRIFVHPAGYEGHSTVMLEAMYSGCDVVSFLPAGDEELKEAQVCASPEQLYATCLTLMAGKKHYHRALYYDMADSARKMYSLLTRI